MLTAILSTAGCDDEPTCTIATGFTGGYAGSVRWNLAGRDSCGVGRPQNLNPNGSALVFVNRETAVTQHLILVPDTPVPNVGVYSGRILLIAGGNIWDSGSGNCSIEITKFEIEDWTLINFISINGRALCSTPLVSASPDVENSELSEVIEFNAHLHDEQLPFEFI